MRALRSELAELRRVARHFSLGRTIVEAGVVVAFVLTVAGAASTLVEPGPTSHQTLIAEARR